MTRLRSPKYPSMPLDEAIERVGNIFSAERQNPIDRATAAQLIGYSGLSGAADKALGSITQYALLERVGRGEVRVTALAQELIHPESEAAKYSALVRAANHPPIFSELFQRYPAGHPIVDAAIAAFLVREGFTDGAVANVQRAFKATSQMIVEAKPRTNASEFDDEDIETDSSDADAAENEVEHQPAQKKSARPHDEMRLGNPEFTEWLRTKVSSEGEVILLTKGNTNARAIRRLIKILETQLEFLEEDEAAHNGGQNA